MLVMLSLESWHMDTLQGRYPDLVRPGFFAVTPKTGLLTKVYE